MSETMAIKTLVVGSINMDLVIRTDKIPLPGENVFGGNLQRIPGGKGANQAVGLARLRCTTLMSGRVGCDDFGEAILMSLQNAGVDTAYVERDEGAPTGMALTVCHQNLFRVTTDIFPPMLEKERYARRLTFVA